MKKNATCLTPQAALSELLFSHIVNEEPIVTQIEYSIISDLYGSKG